MSLFNVLNIAGSALDAQSKRLNVVASNLANAESTTSSTGQPYRARHVEFQAVPVSGNQLRNGATVQVRQIVEDQTPPRKVYDPKHPTADQQGYVSFPNVTAVDEMVNMISASRSYQTNVDVITTTKNMLSRLLTIGQ